MTHRTSRLDHPSRLSLQTLKCYSLPVRTDGYNGGYTSAYDLPGIFRQISSFFSDIRVEQTHGYIDDLQRREAVRNLFSDDFSEDDDDLFFADSGPIDVPPPFVPPQR